MLNAPLLPLKKIHCDLIPGRGHAIEVSAPNAAGSKILIPQSSSYQHFRFCGNFEAGARNRSARVTALAYFGFFTTLPEILQHLAFRAKKPPEVDQP